MTYAIFFTGAVGKVFFFFFNGKGLICNWSFAFSSNHEGFSQETITTFGDLPVLSSFNIG